MDEYTRGYKAGLEAAVRLHCELRDAATDLQDLNWRADAARSLITINNTDVMKQRGIEVLDRLRPQIDEAYKKKQEAHNKLIDIMELISNG